MHTPNKYYHQDSIGKTIIFIFMFLSVIIHCGKKGPLKLTPELLPLPIKDFTVKQIGSNIILEWNFPEFLSDEKTPMQSKQIRSIYIHYADKDISQEKFKRKSILLQRLPWEKLPRDGRKVTFERSFQTRRLDGIKHRFAVYYKYGRKKSPMSKILTQQSALPPLPIDDLKVVKEGKVIKLGWSRPQKDISTNNLSKISGYRVFRKIIPAEPSDEKPEFQVINNKTLFKEYYEDNDTGKDGEYLYYISTVVLPRIESEPSNIIKIKIRDIHPPEIPENLFAFKAKNYVYLSWQKVTDKDLSFYRVYRKTQAQKEFKLVGDKVTENSYSDKGVKKGSQYSYYVTSVDEKNNESNPSQKVEIKF